jgi:hypothetical protein
VAGDREATFVFPALLPPWMRAEREEAPPKAEPAKPARRRRAPSAPTGRGAGANGAELGRSARGRSLRLNVAAGIATLLVGLLHVWTGLQVGRLGYALSDARLLAERLDQEFHLLDAEYAAATTPDRLEREAVRRLGLRHAGPGEFVRLP